MKIIKRDGSEVEFDVKKISTAIGKANDATTSEKELTPEHIDELADNIYQYAIGIGRALTVEEIQELVETNLMLAGAYETAKRYIRYRYEREKKENDGTA